MLASIVDYWSMLSELWYSKQFGGKERIQFFESMVALLENGVGINDGLVEVAKAYSDEGKNPNHPIALACSSMSLSVSNGKKLADTCQAWMPYQEVAIIAAGEKSGNLVQAFSECVRIIEVRQKITSLVLSSTLYPSLLWALMAYLLHVIATRMVPAMARRSDPESWTGIPSLLYSMSTFVNNWGLVTLIGFVLFVVTSIVTLPYFCGPIRVQLERFPPWSIYKALHGSTFLLNIAVMLRSNVNQIEALDALKLNAKPWLRERLAAARYGVRMGKNFGMALKLAGHDFPDKQAVQFLCVLATRKGFSESIHRFSNRWLDNSLKNVERYSKGLLILSSMAIGVLMILVLIGTYSMQADVTNTIQR
ncbi:type II secretion system F family protein [Pseudomonas gingeri]|uniref:type II secretion system F family protein n=1 Tax=Pseudomonas gingeri TaxID=117681 RepID=UPI0015A02DE1|nr:type II secretion system F family protein [Pseudomonas gingeri]NWA23969.1 type II secretion system F family protein [Pseudomonas gingeri]